MSYQGRSAEVGHKLLDRFEELKKQSNTNMTMPQLLEHLLQNQILMMEALIQVMAKQSNED